MSDKQANELPIAYARYGAPDMIWGHERLIVDECPYCGHAHRHMANGTKDVPNVRLADCFRGEYQIVIKRDTR
jgi:hypothetical protein